MPAGALLPRMHPTRVHPKCTESACKKSEHLHPRKRTLPPKVLKMSSTSVGDLATAVLVYQPALLGIVIGI